MGGVSRFIGERYLNIYFRTLLLELLYSTGIKKVKVFNLLWESCAALIARADYRV